jgi:hypothetical protein
LFLTVGVIALAISLYYMADKMNRSKIPGTLVVGTTPSVVKITMDGKPLEKGAYIKTPITLKKLSKGPHSLTFFRDGFAEETLNVDLQGPLLQEDVVLKRIKEMSPVRLRFQGGNEKKIQVSLNNGMYLENLDPKTTVNMEYVPFGDNHTLTVGKLEQSGFKCSFVPKANNWREPFLITIFLDEKRCDFQKDDQP